MIFGLFLYLDDKLSVSLLRGTNKLQRYTGFLLN